LSLRLSLIAHSWNSDQTTVVEARSQRQDLEVLG
jgi:hypothetical protein